MVKQSRAAADSLAAVRYLVDEQKLVTMAELAAILKADWKDAEELRLRARRSPLRGGRENGTMGVRFCANHRNEHKKALAIFESM